MKLKAGETYVFKDKESRERYRDQFCSNQDSIRICYRDGFTLDSVDSRGDGWIRGDVVIVLSEIKYFKLKEEKQMKPDDIISVEMTALEALRVRVLVGHVSRNLDLYSRLRDGIGLPSGLCEKPISSKLNWNYDSDFTLWCLDQFKNPKQDKIDELEKKINDAAAELAKLKGE